MAPNFLVCVKYILKESGLSSLHPAVRITKGKVLLQNN